MSRLILTCAIFALACSSSDDNGGSSGSGGSSAADSGPDVTADAPSESAADALTETSTDAPTADAPTDATPDAPADAPTEATPDAPADVATDVGPVLSCDELNTIDCFANNECETDRRCENAGTVDDQVPCCVLGSRGTGQAGDSCVNENDCESAVCIAGSGPYMCSKTCTTNDDCPDGMKDCTFIAFSGSNDMWCLPTD